MLRPNVLLAAIVGLILGVIAEFFFAFANRLPVLGCLTAPIALIFDLGLPILVGILAAAWGAQRGLLTAPRGAIDGGIAAALAELVSQIIGFCASLFAASRFFFGPRSLLPSVGPAAHGLFAGIWELGWLVVSLALAAALGALGGILYRAAIKR